MRVPYNPQAKTYVSYSFLALVAGNIAGCAGRFLLWPSRSPELAACVWAHRAVRVSGSYDWGASLCDTQI